MYCTQTDLEQRFTKEELIELTDGDNLGVVNSATVNDAIDDAVARINGYLQGRYSLPLSVVPRVLERISCDMARFYLFKNGAPEDVGKANDSALSFLKDVARGVASLGISESNAAPLANDVAVMESDGRVFDRDDSKGFI